MRRPLHLLVNPRAGEGRQAGLLAGARALDEHFETTRLDSSQGLEAALRGRRWPQHAGVVVFGGDGTVNGALPALMSTGLPLAVFPAGTVNDLARELGATSDWPELLALLRDGVPAPMDVAVVNERPFAVYATLGLGAENSRYMHRTRHRFRALRRRYPLLLTPLFGARTILLSRRYVRRVRLTLAGATSVVTTPGCYFANQSHLGNDIALGWDRRAAQGKLLAVVLHDAGRLALLRLLRTLFARKALAAIRDRVDVHETDRLLVESLDGGTLPLYGDGEPLVDAPRLEFRVLPGALQVYRRDASRSA